MLPQVRHIEEEARHCHAEEASEFLDVLMASHQQQQQQAAAAAAATATPAPGDSPPAAAAGSPRSSAGGSDAAASPAAGKDGAPAPGGGGGGGLGASTTMDLSSAIAHVMAEHPRLNLCEVSASASLFCRPTLPVALHIRRVQRGLWFGLVC